MANKNWVVTSFDNNIPKSKKKPSATTRVTLDGNEGGRAVTPDASENKGTSNSGDVQAETENSGEKSGNTTGRPSFSVEAPLRDALVERLGNAGIDVVTDEAEGQRVLDAHGERQANLRAAT